MIVILLLFAVVAVELIDASGVKDSGILSLSVVASVSSFSM